MATQTIRNLDSLITRAQAGEYNKSRLDELNFAAGVISHADASAAIATTIASDLPTSITLANDLKTQMNAHFARAMTSGAILLVAP